MSRSPKSKGRKRAPKASQGDAVLVGFMGGLNHPDLATRAGEEPLPHEDDSDPGEPMEVDGKEEKGNDEVDHVQLAGNALSLVESENAKSENVKYLGSPETPKNEHMRPERPKVLTQTKVLVSRTPVASIDTTSEAMSKPPDDEAPPNPKASRAATDGLRIQKDDLRSSISTSRSKSPGSNESDSVAISPMLRRFTIPNSERPSSAETLPAMQRSPPDSASKSPNSQQKLPSLQAIELETLLHNPLPQNGANRRSGSLSAGSVRSPPMSAIASRSPAYPSPKSRMDGPFHPSCSHGQPSPAYTDASPRDSVNMSPPGKPATPSLFPYYPRRTPQSEGSTPQSAESYPSSSSFSTAPSPHLEHMEVDRAGRLLPPLEPHPGPALMTGTFKCNHPKCNAPPFQTQYLLNSHANVHSQNRPHYCPVPTCPRSEGGKGFKRKNEMIRHGLVHESPGYICPFCPEREHKYPRPDNLQRHVRVNHMDKDMNDPELREVLSQRLEGGSRGRRRRIGI